MGLDGDGSGACADGGDHAVFNGQNLLIGGFPGENSLCIERLDIGSQDILLAHGQAGYGGQRDGGGLVVVHNLDLHGVLLAVVGLDGDGDGALLDGNHEAVLVDSGILLVGSRPGQFGFGSCRENLCAELDGFADVGGDGAALIKHNAVSHGGIDDLHLDGVLLAVLGGNGDGGGTGLDAFHIAIRINGGNLGGRGLPAQGSFGGGGLYFSIQGEGLAEADRHGAALIQHNCGYNLGIHNLNLHGILLAVVGFDGDGSRAGLDAGDKAVFINGGNLGRRGLPLQLAFGGCGLEYSGELEIIAHAEVYSAAMIQFNAGGGIRIHDSDLDGSLLVVVALDGNGSAALAHGGDQAVCINGSDGLFAGGIGKYGGFVRINDGFKLIACAAIQGSLGLCQLDLRGNVANGYINIAAQLIGGGDGNDNGGALFVLLDGELAVVAYLYDLGIRALEIELAGTFHTVVIHEAGIEIEGLLIIHAQVGLGNLNPGGLGGNGNLAAVLDAALVSRNSDGSFAAADGGNDAFCVNGGDSRVAALPAQLCSAGGTLQGSGQRRLLADVKRHAGFGQGHAGGCSLDGDCNIGGNGLAVQGSGGNGDDGAALCLGSDQTIGIHGNAAAFANGILHGGAHFGNNLCAEGEGFAFAQNQLADNLNLFDALAVAALAAAAGQAIFKFSVMHDELLADCRAADLALAPVALHAVHIVDIHLLVFIAGRAEAAVGIGAGNGSYLYILQTLMPYLICGNCCTADAANAGILKAAGGEMLFGRHIIHAAFAVIGVQGGIIRQRNGRIVIQAVDMLGSHAFDRAVADQAKTRQNTIDEMLNAFSGRSDALFGSRSRNRNFLCEEFRVDLFFCSSFLSGSLCHHDRCSNALISLHCNFSLSKCEGREQNGEHCDHRNDALHILHFFTSLLVLFL